MSTCETCETYMAVRLPHVLKAWFNETGQRVTVRTFMAGVHDRHLTGFPVLPGEAA